MMVSVRAPVGRSGRGRALAGVVLLVGMALASPATSVAQASGPAVVGVDPLTCLDDALNTYARSGAGWTGGDSTWSASLADGRELFAFSDTFLAPGSGPSRPAQAPFVHNSFLVRNPDRSWTTVVADRSGRPAAVLRPADPSQWYWLGAATFLGGILQVPLTQWRTVGPGPLDFELVGSALAQFDPTNLQTPQSVTPLPSTRGIQWGQWVEHVDDWTYVYGVETGAETKRLHVARVPGTDLRQGFSFWTGWGWLPGEWSSVPVADDVFAELSVHRVRPGLFMLTTMEGGTGFSGRVIARVGPSPTGPFGSPVELFSTPELGPQGSYGDADVYTYNAHVHPEYSTPDRLVISYNVNSLDTAPGGDVYRDTSIYRPRFVVVSLSWPDAGPVGTEPARQPC